MSDLMLPAYQKLYAALQSLFPNGQRMSCMTCNGVMYAKVMSALESLTMMPLPTIKKNSVTMDLSDMALSITIFFFENHDFY